MAEHSHQREIVFRRQEPETAPHLVITSDTGYCELERGQIGKHIGAVLT